VESASGSLAELRSVLDAVPEAVLVFDAEGRVRFANPAVDRMFQGRAIIDHRDLMSRFEPLPAARRPRARLVRPTRMPNLWYELRSVPPAVGAETGARPDPCSATPPTEQPPEGATPPSILARPTPITTIYAGSRLLSRRGRRGAAARREIATDISVEAARLYDLVEDLLALTRVERELLEMTDEPVSLPRAVEIAVRTVASRTPEVAIIAAGATDPPAVRGDADYVENAVRNLIASAIQFGGLEAPVIVRIEPGEGEVAVRVLDRRPDTTPAELSMSFALVDEPTAPRRLRLGIPLFVTRRLVETMGGRVWARPRTDGGAELGFALPAYAYAEAD
jgi:hypothetical protein